ncbi:hypothetical protein PDE_05966 [Penicillium oxalicum 114-2]|uniref:Uncharacterized protein n=1 Tax=Penicillium oxalicum (strain 114-2 / CGMCC 5302) TaxID=933388 RepID=S8B8E4_PENO1|nr:hypothetical protein PDE_05966 [Penicillium oxalicum 114-2]
MARIFKNTQRKGTLPAKGPGGTLGGGEEEEEEEEILPWRAYTIKP